MSETLHPVEPEEVMAVLDGQLTSDRAARTERHLRECAECQTLASDLQSVSRQMKNWEIKAPKSPMPTILDAALSGRRDIAARKGFVAWLPKTSAGWVLGCATAAMVAVFTLGFLFSSNSYRSAPATTKTLPLRQEALDSEARVLLDQPAPGGNGDRLTLKNKIQASGQLALIPESIGAGLSTRTQAASSRAMAQTKGALDNGTSGLKLVTMIARSAQLNMVVVDFPASQARLEEILKQHDGYIGDMKVSAPEDSARKLTAELRVPAAQMDATLGDLKKLGRVESESQNGEDMTSQYVDLEARLKNARSSEQRLTDLLQQRTGKLSDVVEVEDKISDVRESIERMEAEQKNLSTRVQFATVSVSLTEEHKAQLNVVPPSVGTRFHNAAVEGYQSVVEGLVSFLLFLISWGPTLLIWAAVLFFPVRFAWRRLHREA